MVEDVVVVGAGPTGLMLACELALAGVRPVVLERLAEPTGMSKALGILGRAVDVLDGRGLLDRFPADAGIPPFLHFGMIPLDADGLEDVGLRGIMVRQAETERVLAERADELGVEVRRGCEITGLRQDDDGVTLDVRGRGTVRARYVVGCDGGRSAVRALAGIEFPGLAPTHLFRLGEIEPDGEPPRGVFPVGDGCYRVVSGEPYPDGFDRDAPMTLDELRASFRRTTGQDLPVRRTHWLTRFTNASRQAAQYRSGRVLLAGDAAHIHMPAGGPGINTGLLDAVNLGWKLAASVLGWAPAGLLDTYHSDRHPEGARVLLSTRAQSAIAQDAPFVPALREVLGRVLRSEGARREVVAVMFGLDARYGDGTGPVGKWMPARVELPEPEFVLVGFDGEVDGWADRVRVVSGQRDGVPLLVRPDGHVAWAGDGELHDALAAWVGPATPAARR